MTPTRDVGRRKIGFTLIELLVVVAIIALLISILLPSLSKARAQARTTLCASRMSQLIKAMFLYANDYDEKPPFVARGIQNPADAVDEYKRENWISADMDQIWTADERDWPQGLCPRSGSLFAYTRFDTLYRCPDFERTAGKTQSVFNYTRSILCRKIICPWEDGGDEYYDLLGIGPILGPSQVYAPATMMMMVDESWQFHVAYQDYYQGRGLTGPKCADPIYFVFESEYGQYHGPAITRLRMTDLHLPEGPSVPDAINQATLGFYDGHVSLDRDPAPGRSVPDALKWLPSAIDYALRSLFAQRGITPTGEQVSEVLTKIKIL
ncbi:MAG: prepilin-type N-terminal cleavage/methylation domain-containing protein [Phycisphaerae bacterium]|nr:prepilin-type N-terminal cleavage/methylation domain-containing protein [Phycisphaerae bacterium]